MKTFSSQQLYKSSLLPTCVTGVIVYEDLMNFGPWNVSLKYASIDVMCCGLNIQVPNEVENLTHAGGKLRINIPWN